MTPDTSRACPSAEELAGFLDGGLSVRDRAAVAQHAAECDECRVLLSGAAATLVAYDARPGRPARWPLALPAAAAAIALLVLWWQPHSGPAPVVDTLRAPGTTLVEDVPRFATRDPAEGASIAAAAPAFEWDAVADEAVYRITVSDESGTILWSARTGATRASMPAPSAAALVPGHPYYWRVEALLPDLSTAVTDLRRFEVHD